VLGKLKDLTLNRDGSQNVTITVQGDFRQAYDELADKDIDVTIKKYSKRRSMDSNNLAWMLIDQIAEKMGITKNEVYRNAIKEIGGVSDFVCVKNYAVEHFVKGWVHKGLGWQVDVEPSKLPGCSNLTVYYGSSVFTTKQMNDLINSLIQEANQLGIATMTQAEIDRSLAVWAKKQNEQVDTTA